MDVLLNDHGANVTCNIPEGLSELCSDISREVLRCQPHNLYTFIADYADALLITRENTKVAIKVVNHVLKESDNLITILHRHGLSFKKIVTVAPKLQEIFREYIDSLNEPCGECCQGSDYDDRSEISIQRIMEECCLPLDQANAAATIIQRAFRSHYQQMVYRESKGEIQWQRALVNTIQIMKKAGVSISEINESLPTIMSTYKSYYTRKNQVEKTKSKR